MLSVIVFKLAIRNLISKSVSWDMAI